MTGHLPYRLDLLAAAVTPGNRAAGTVHGEVDGDTIDVLTYDVVIDRLVVVRVRVMIDGRTSVNCPDRGEEGFREVNAAVAAWLPPGRLVVLTIFKADKYSGRIDAAIDTAGGESLAGWLLAQGYAVRWNGTGDRPKVPWPPVPAP